MTSSSFAGIPRPPASLLLLAIGFTIAGTLHLVRPAPYIRIVPPWLPMPAGWDQFAVDVQLSSGTSMLGYYQRALELRRRLAGRLSDRIEWCPAPEGVLLYQRGPLVVACNFRSRPVRLEVGGRLLATSSVLARHRRRRLTLPPNSAAWLDVSPA